MHGSNQSWRRDFNHEHPVPQINMDAMLCLARLVNRRMSGFEYGSGSSTLWLAGRCARLISVEHKYKWFKRVKFALNKRTNLEHVMLRYVPVDEKKHSGFIGVDKESYKKYVNSILDHPRKFNFVIIDGRCRARCLEVAVKKVCSGGLVMFDNCQRTKYHPFIKKYLSDWDVVRMFHGTGIWRRK